ncbi:MAG: hypothetical protein KDA62_20515, partial [Planctomycetales bacterium]|nr:hypothetical protein [Planctomycetales bacterium]
MFRSLSRRTKDWIFRAILVAAILGIGYSMLRPYIASFFPGDSLSRMPDAESSGHSAFEVSEASVPEPVQRQLDLLRPEQAGWTSESMSVEIDKSLKRLAADPSASANELVSASFHGEV